MRQRTFAYWPTRIMLGVALLAPVAVALLYLAAPQTMGPPPMSDDRMGWVVPVVLAVGAVLWLVGVVWMVSIFRGPRDEPPAWRHRDRR